MRKRLLIIAVILSSGSGMVAQIHIPELKDIPAGLGIVKKETLKHAVSQPYESADFQWYSFPSPSTDEVTQTSITCDGSEMLVFYRQPNPSLNIDEGPVKKWSGSAWSNFAHLTNQCHEPDIDIKGTVAVATWYDDSYDYGYGTNVNGPWVAFTGTYLVDQWFPRAAMAMGLPYMSFASRYTDGHATSFMMLHIKSIVGVGEQIELNGGWTVTNTSVGMRTDITGDENAWYCVFSQQQFLYVMKGSIVNSVKEYSDLGDRFRMYNPVSNPEIVLYKDKPVVGWFENSSTELYIAEWNGSQWMILGTGSVPNGNLYSLRMAASSNHLFVTYATTESDTEISVNLWDGENWYEMPPAQDKLNSNIGTVDIAVHNEEPVVAFTENKLLTVKKFTSTSITNAGKIISDPQLLTCFPNPTHDMITVQTNETGAYLMKLCTLTGQVIQRQNFTGNALTIDISSYPKGIYFISLKKEGFAVTRRIIKL